MKTPEYQKALDLALKVRAEKHAEVAASVILSALREVQQPDSGSLTSAQGQPSEETGNVLHAPNQIKSDSWLNRALFAQFKQGYEYAQTQTMAIPALSKCSPEELFYAVDAIVRGSESVAQPSEDTERYEEMCTALERISRACDEEMRLPYYRDKNPPAVLGAFAAIKSIADAARGKEVERLRSQPSEDRALQDFLYKLGQDLFEIENHCPCGARPESLNAFPHVGGCSVERAIKRSQEFAKGRGAIDAVRGKEGK